jgi:cobalt/nickel transport system ATP-binding protein
MAPVLEVSGLGFGYGAAPILKGISFHVEAGEAVGLVGANGSGKSTLLWCVAGLLGGTGTVRLFGGPPAKAGRARMGMVFQNPEDQLFMPSLAQDLALPLVNRGMPPDQAAAEARQWLERLGLEAHADVPATHLSLGQRKRAAVALAMIRCPEFLILDEPTAELDGSAVRRLAAMLKELPVARLVASHHLEFLRATTSRILLLSGGEIAAQGSSAEILDNTELLERAGLI